MRSANIIGSGPNGLTAAVTLALAGVQVSVFERNVQPGGAAATGELTLPGFLHDIGSSVFPLGIASPAFRALQLEECGLNWLQPGIPMAHPLDDGSSITLESEVESTISQFSAHDARNYRLLLGPTIRAWEDLVDDFTRGLLRVPKHPVAMGVFGIPALLPAQVLARLLFRDERARALFAGCAAHSVIPFTKASSSAVALVMLAAGHTTGWPIARGGAVSISRALVNRLTELGGKLYTGVEVTSLTGLPHSDITLFDTSAESMASISGDALSLAFRQRITHFRPGPGIFKIDYALREPIPWRDLACLQAATVHLGGTLAEIARSEHDAFYGRHNERPFVLVTQPSLIDSTRAPLGRHTAWAYCHVPYGSERDMSASIETQIERFAPGFRDVVLDRCAWNTRALGRWNLNLAKGDISGGAMTLKGMLARPTIRGHRTSNARIYLASASTPPGGGVHGMCGYLAASAALADHRQH